MTYAPTFYRVSSIVCYPTDISLTTRAFYLEVILVVFSSIQFIFGFLPIFLLLYYITPNKYRNAILFFGSLVFYTFGEPLYIILLLVSLYINYTFGIFLTKTTANKKRKILLLFTLLFNFGMLFSFKYMNFFIDNINLLLQYLSRTYSVQLFLLPNVKILLPLGISFYTFQIVSYLFDIYYKKMKAEKNLLMLGTYLCMFPQLIAGPIVIYKDIYRELRHRTHSLEAVEDGLKTFTLGLSSKVLIANPCGSLWRDIQVIGFESISTPLAWLGMFAFTFQIYFDFNGYSLMAIGLGQMLGLTIPKNFNQPYASKSVTDFWKRWHITLGRWFREYVYIPMGGSRKGNIRLIFNLLIVWSLTGFWHGASWNFLLWGLTFFVLITIEKLFLLKWLNQLYIFPRIYMLLVIPLSWMLFAIEKLSDIRLYFEKLFPSIFDLSLSFLYPPDIVKPLSTYGLFLAAAFLLCIPIFSRLYDKYKNRIVLDFLLFALFWLSIYRLFSEVNNPFLYFRF